MLETLSPIALLIYGLPFLLAFAWYMTKRHRSERRSAQRLTHAIESGLNEPSSLHPIIDPNRCIGSSACVTACPESALGVIDGVCAGGILPTPFLKEIGVQVETKFGTA